MEDEQFLSKIYYDKYLFERIIWTELGAYVFGMRCVRHMTTSFNSPEQQNQKYTFGYWKLLPKGDYSSIYSGFDHLRKYLSDQFKMFSSTRSLPTSQLQKIKNKIDKLGVLGTRKKIIEGIKCFRTMEERNCNWNSNPMLFQFENAVFDLEHQRFLPPDPKFRINRSCGYEFDFTLIGSERLVIAMRKIYDCVSAMFSDEISEIREIIFSLLSSFLVKGNKEEVAYFFIGDGRNGKGLLSSLLNFALGYFFQDLPMSYYTKPASGQERMNAALYECKDAFVINSSEIGVENNGQPENFRLETIKVMTGGDGIKVRRPYGTFTIRFVPGKILVQLNDLPGFLSVDNGEDHAILKRIIVIEFPCNFTDDENEIKSDPKRFKKRDDNLKTLFSTPLYRQAFIMILMRHFPKYLEGCADGSYKKCLLQQFGFQQYMQRHAMDGTVPEDPEQFDADVEDKAFDEDEVNLKFKSLSVDKFKKTDESNKK